MVNTPLCDSHQTLEKGTLTSRVDGNPHAYRICVLNSHDIDAVLRVQDETVRHIQDSSIYYPDTTGELIEASLSNDGLIIGCFAKERIVAFRSIWYPRLRPENQGLDIGMREPSQLSQVAHLERTCVIPEFTGNRLQMQMTNHAIDLARRTNSFCYLFSTVAPMNYASMQDKFSADMQIVKLVKKYKDYYRYIFFQNVMNPIHTNSQPPSSIRLLDGDDIEAQVRLLGQDGAMVGCLQQRSGELMQVGYTKIECKLF